VYTAQSHNSQGFWPEILPSSAGYASICCVYFGCRLAASAWFGFCFQESSINAVVGLCGFSGLCRCGFRPWRTATAWRWRRCFCRLHCWRFRCLLRFWRCLNFGSHAWRLGGSVVLSTFGCDGFWATWCPTLLIPALLITSWLIPPLVVTGIIAILITALPPCLITPLVATLVSALLTALLAALLTIAGLGVFALALVAVAAALFVLCPFTLLLFSLGGMGAQYAVIMFGMLKQVFSQDAIASGLCIPRLGEVPLQHLGCGTAHPAFWAIAVERLVAWARAPAAIATRIIIAVIVPTTGTTLIHVEFPQWLAGIVANAH